MKLILLTSPEFFVEEDKILKIFFEEGLDTLHLRKPDSEPIYSERLLSLLPEQYHHLIVPHDNFYLCQEYELGGIHLSRRNSTPPSGYSGPVSRTCYALEELEEAKAKSRYVLLRNVFQSISEPYNKASFTTTQLMEACQSGLIDAHVMAEGGVSLEKIPMLRDWGFGGVVIRGDIWGKLDIHHQQDFTSIIQHFRLLRKATL